MRKNPHYASLLKVLRETGQKIQQSVILTYEFDPQLAETLANNGVVAFNGTEDGFSIRPELKLPSGYQGTFKSIFGNEVHFAATTLKPTASF